MGIAKRAKVTACKHMIGYKYMTLSNRFGQAAHSKPVRFLRIA